MNLWSPHLHTYIRILAHTHSHTVNYKKMSLSHVPMRFNPRLPNQHALTCLLHWPRSHSDHHAGSRTLEDVTLWSCPLCPKAEGSFGMSSGPEWRSTAPSFSLLIGLMPGPADHQVSAAFCLLLELPWNAEVGMGNVAPIWGHQESTGCEWSAP